MLFFCNVFNDPSSPWYYVIGVIFLVLIFGALAAYIILSDRLKKKSGDTDEQNGRPIEKEAETVDTDTAVNADAVADTDAAEENKDSKTE